MFRGRILIVTDRPGVAAELDPLIRAEGHLSLAVPSPDEAIQVLEDGIVPDIVISDLSDRHAADTAYLTHFHRLNQLGQHLGVVRPGAEATAAEFGARWADSFDTLRHPFDADRVRASIVQAMDRIRRDLESVRGEMFRETARLQRAIRDAQLELVTALAKIMEAQDPFMQGHCERVAGLARRLATSMEVEETDVELLANAALLHEIGKVGISLDLLHKPSPLTPEELERVRGHTHTGAQIVAAVPSLRALAPLIENQYTDFRDLDAVFAPETPQFLLASILRVADVFDAMTSDRSYRGGLSRDRWEAVLREGSGTRFHPAVIEAFFRVGAREAA